MVIRPACPENDSKSAFHESEDHQKTENISESDESGCLSLDDRQIETHSSSASPRLLGQNNEFQLTTFNTGISNDKCCRICGDSSGHLISPCNCRGTTAFVHPKCLHKWLSSPYNNSGRGSCEICKGSYDFELLEHGIAIEIIESQEINPTPPDSDQGNPNVNFWQRCRRACWNSPNNEIGSRPQRRYSVRANRTHFDWTQFFLSIVLFLMVGGVVAALVVLCIYGTTSSPSPNNPIIK